MSNTSDSGMMAAKRQTYLPMAGYVLAALLVRAAAFSPLAVLWAVPTGSALQWIAVLCPLLLVFVVLPLRMSFAQAAMDAAQGGGFSIRQAFNLTGYAGKLWAALKHALRVLLWSLPLLVFLGELFYLLFTVDLVGAIRTITAFGEGAANALTGITNFVVGLFGGAGVQLDFGFLEGLYVIASIGALALLVFLWGAWRCSVYRYLWVQHAAAGQRMGSITTAMRGHRVKQLLYGLYNAFLSLPTLLFALFVTLSMYDKADAMISAAFDTTQSFAASWFEALLTLLGMAIHLTITVGDLLLIAIGVLVHLLILPLRRSATALLAAAAKPRV